MDAAIPKLCVFDGKNLRNKTALPFYYITKSNLISIILSILVAVITYAVTLLLLKGLGEDELRKFPKGHLLVLLAKKFRLLK